MRRGDLNPIGYVSNVNRRVWDGSMREYNAKPRVYLGEDKLHDMISPPEYMSLPKPIADRMLRAQIDFMKPALEKAVGEAFGCEVTLTFSAKAGCSCGCSPGFIVTNNPAEMRRTDIWVSVYPSCFWRNDEA